MSDGLQIIQTLLSFSNWDESVPFPEILRLKTKLASLEKVGNFLRPAVHVRSSLFIPKMLRVRHGKQKQWRVE